MIDHRAGGNYLLQVDGSYMYIKQRAAAATAATSGTVQEPEDGAVGTKSKER